MPQCELRLVIANGVITQRYGRRFTEISSFSPCTLFKQVENSPILLLFDILKPAQSKLKCFSAIFTTLIFEIVRLTMVDP